MTSSEHKKKKNKIKITMVKKRVDDGHEMLPCYMEKKILAR